MVQQQSMQINSNHHLVNVQNYQQKQPGQQMNYIQQPQPNNLSKFKIFLS